MTYVAIAIETKATKGATVLILAAARGQLNVVKYFAGGKGAAIELSLIHI